VAKSFRELKVWQLSIELSVLVYSLTESFPKHELYGLTSQMRRCAVSIASNIAEGSARSTRRDFRQFVLIAKGSVCELQTQLIIAQRLKYAQTERLATVEQCSKEVAQMLSGLAQYLNVPSPPKQTR
jgi:four helix bundle protein